MTKPQPKVLIVDDDKAILDNLSAFLVRGGFHVDYATDGQAALTKISEYQPDIVILDVIMPVMDGRQTLRELRHNDNWLPVILLTQVGDATERAMALTEGADDYLNKPYDPYELVARINAVLRRAKTQTVSLISADVLNADTLSFNRKSRIASLDGERLNLTPRANHLLEYLMLHPDEVLHRERLLNAVWGWNFSSGTRSVDARIVELRKVLGKDAQTQFIETVPGEGYRFTPRVQASRQS